nr:hypothetical protein [Tanacetum cinerariifolium]
MKLKQFQVNTKFFNTLPPEWSKFVTDVKLVRDLHTTNIDQLNAYLGQHEFHVNEYGSPYQSQQYSHNQSSTPLSITYPPNDFQSSVHHNVYSSSSSIPQMDYAPLVNQQPEFSQPDSGLIVLVLQKVHHNIYSPPQSIPQLENPPAVNLLPQQAEFPQLDSGLTIPVFKQSDDPIDAINHMMSFLSAVVTSRYPTTNNQPRNSSNPRQQATINDGRVTLQPVHGRQILLLLVLLGLTHKEQVEAILRNKRLLFVTTAKGKDTCPNNALNLKGNRLFLV